MGVYRRYELCYQIDVYYIYPCTQHFCPLIAAHGHIIVEDDVSLIQVTQIFFCCNNQNCSKSVEHLSFNPIQMTCHIYDIHILRYKQCRTPRFNLLSSGRNPVQWCLSSSPDGTYGGTHKSPNIFSKLYSPQHLLLLLFVHL